MPNPLRVPLRLLNVEDSPDDAELLLLELSQGGFDVCSKLVATAAELQTALAEGPWDFVSSDFSMPGFDAPAALDICRAFDPDIPFVVVSGTIGEDRAVEMMRAGANDYLLKGSLARLTAVVQRELREAANRRLHRQTAQAVSLLAAIVESSDDAIISKTLEGVVTSWNPAAERLLGWGVAEAIGRHISFVVPPENADEMNGILERLNRGEHIKQYETVRLHKDGTKLDVSITISPIRDREGRLSGISKVARDIRDRKRAEMAMRENEKKLRASEVRYRTLIAATAAIVWDSPASGEFDSEQPGWTAFTGQTIEEHRGWGWLNVLHPDDREKSALAWAKSVAGQGIYQVDHRLRRTDGEYRDMSARAVPILDSGGAIREWVGIHTDVTEAKKVEIERTKLLTQLNLQIERMPLAYLLTGPDFLYTRWNPAAERIFGFNEAEVLGKHPFHTIVPIKSQKVVTDIFARLARGEMEAHGQSENTVRDGRTIFCEWYNTPLFGPDGDFQGVLSLAQDITSRRTLEEQYRQAQKMEAFGQLAGGVAHDFNNLLTIINGYSNILLRTLPKTDPSRRLIEEIHSAGERSAGLTRQLLAFSRQQVLAPRVLDLNEVVAETDKMLRRLIGEDVRLTTSLASALWSVRADPGQIEQVLLNLAVNARDAMPTGGQLTIETHNVKLDESYVRAHKDSNSGEHVVLSVSDTGCGIPPEELAKIFEPFFTTKAPGKGTGLGLATVYGIVKQSGGHATVYSEIGIGTTFKVYLPRVEAADAASKSDFRLRMPPRGTETVLVAEDEAGVRELASHILESCGYKVLVAANGEEAVKLAANHVGPIHLLLTDVVMPGLGGRYAAEQISAGRSEIRVLFMSGYTDDAVIRHGVLREAMNFLQKPFSPDALAFKVRAILDARAATGLVETASIAV